MDSVTCAPPVRLASLLGTALLVLLLACPSARAQVFTETEIRDPMEEFPVDSNLEFPQAFHSVPLGDLDDDGYPDVAFSDGALEDILADWFPSPHYSHGAVWIAFMQVSRRGQGQVFVRHRRSIEADELGIPTPYFFGHSIAAIGDLDGDGNTELAVGSWSDGRDGTSVGGEVYVLFLNDDGSVRRVTLLTARPWSGRWGRTMTFMGDLDGDGVVELAVSADPASPGDGPGVVLVSINSLGYVFRTKEITSQIEAYHDYEAGWTYLANAGDINGDGVNDLVSGDIRDRDLGAGEGSFYVVFLDPRGDVISVRKQRNIEDNLAGGGGDAFGYALASAGDLNRDGVPDLVVGAPGDREEATGAIPSGAIWILTMNRDGSVRGHVKGRGGELYGWGLGALGDLNGDGSAEVGSMQSYYSYTISTYEDIFIRRGGGIPRHVFPPHFSAEGEGNLSSDYFFGAAVEPLGEMAYDDAAYPVVAAGTPDDDEGALRGGAVYLLYLTSNPDESVSVEHARKIVPGLKGMVEDDPQEPGEILPPCRSRNEERDGKDSKGPGDQTRPDRLPPCPASGLPEYAHFGRGLALLDDLDGNGLRDLAVGAPGHDLWDRDTPGAVWILGLEPNGEARVLFLIDRFTPSLTGATRAANEFGHAVAYLGDTDGDGAFELAVGLPGIDAVYVLSVRPTGEVTRVRKIADGEGGLPPGTVQEGSRFGNALALADVTGDGTDELLVGAPLYDEAGAIGEYERKYEDAGAVYVLSLSPGARVMPPVHRISSESLLATFSDDAPARHTRFGWSVSGLDDLNGDGREDLIIGAPGKGSAYIVHVDATMKVDGGFFIAGGRGGLQGPLGATSRLGASVSPIVLRRDGLLELVVGAEGGPGRWTRDEGAVWVLGTQLPADEAIEGDPVFEDSISENPPGASAGKAHLAEEVPDEYTLGASYPNPFNPQTRIRFGLPEPGPVRLEVFDVLGRSVRVLADGPHEAGWHDARFDGARLPSGVYFYRINAGPFAETKQMLLVK